MNIASELAGMRRPRVLFVRLDNTGDVVLLSPAVRTLKETLPDCSLALWCTKAGAQAAPLVEGLDEVIVSRPIWQEIGCTAFDPEDDRRLIVELRGRRFEAAFIFTSFSQSPHPAAVACALAGIPRRAGSSGEQAGGGLLFEAAPPPFAEHQADRDLSLLEECGFHVADRSVRLQVPEWRPPGGRPGGYVVVSPWASCAARSYPAERMLEAARAIAGARGWAIYLAGRDSERNRAAALISANAVRESRDPRMARSAPVVDLVGQTTVPQLAGLVAGARLVFCNNTLALHLADGCRTPVVVTYAGTDLDSHWRPRDTPHRLLRRDTRCAPCFLLTCPSGHECLDIPARELAAEAEALLASDGRRAARPAAATVPA